MSDDNEGVLCIPQRPSTSEASLSDCLMSYPGHSLKESYSSADMQSVYSVAPADWAVWLFVFSNANYSGNGWSFYIELKGESEPPYKM